jgi:WD40 repeat protein
MTKVIVVVGKEIVVIDLDSPEDRVVLQGHTEIIDDVHVNLYGVIASCSVDRTIRLWNSDGECVRIIFGFEIMRTVQFSPDGSTVVSSDWDRVQIWDTGSGECLSTLENEVINRIRFSPNGELVVLVGNKLLVHDAVTGNRITELIKRDNFISSACGFMGNDVFVLGSFIGELRIWNAPFDQNNRNSILLLQTDDGIASLAISPDQTTIALGLNNGNIVLVNPSTLVQRVFTGNVNSVSGLEFTGQSLVSSSQDGTVRVWDTDSGENTETVRLNEYIFGLCILPETVILL